MSSNSNRLPFYKPPQQNTNQYKFENADLDKVAVVQRFKNRNPPQVTEGSRANQAGIKLGDSIVKINDTDTKNMSLAEAHQRIQESGNDIKLSVKRLVILMGMCVLLNYIVNVSKTNDFCGDHSHVKQG